MGPGVTISTSETGCHALKMKTTSLTTCFLMAATVMAAACTKSPSVQLKVTAVRVMSDEEQIKIAGPDFIGADVLARFTLSAPSREISFYGCEFNKKPLGHSTVWSRDGEMRVNSFSRRSEPTRVSPGIDDVNCFGLPTSWFPLRAGEVVAFDSLDGTGSAGEKHGVSVFIKVTPNKAPIEIFSAPYIVPAALVRKP
jgi:hypothetical protein